MVSLVVSRSCVARGRTSCRRAEPARSRRARGIHPTPKRWVGRLVGAAAEGVLPVEVRAERKPSGLGGPVPLGRGLGDD
jgi:hypothetical protein